MHAELLALAADLAHREEPFVLAVVVRRRPASSSQAGDMALITAAGGFHGWLGGSCTQPTVVREARSALSDGRPRLLALTPEAGPEFGDLERRPGVVVFPMTCHSGGTVEIYLEPILPAPRLVVFGASPTARALVRLAKAMGYTVVAVAADTAAAERETFPEADEVLTDLGALAQRAFPRPPFAVVATMGERDEESIQAALALRPAYLGVVASARRFAQMRQTLLSSGVSEEALAGIRSPAGVAIGAQLPEEIALSVLAEVVERRRAAEVVSEPAPMAEATVAPATALDPVCGMTVEIAGARHVAEHAGQTYYFCCAGCRTRFLAEPARYVLAQAPTPAGGAA